VKQEAGRHRQRKGWSENRPTRSYGGKARSPKKKREKSACRIRFRKRPLTKSGRAQRFQGANPVRPPAEKKIARVNLTAPRPAADPGRKKNVLDHRIVARRSLGSTGRKQMKDDPDKREGGGETKTRRKKILW